MTIGSLFAKSIDRPIEGVIKADDERFLKTEVEEYVITDEVMKGLDQFAHRYVEETNANGIWISGFFGSGKSHVLKILSLVLENRQLPDGRGAADIFLENLDDELLRGALQNAVAIPSQSLLFNIDQKADAVGGDRDSPILSVFIKVLNELCGYCGKQGHIAEFEHDLDERGELETFKATYARISGSSWEHDLPVIETLRNKVFAKALAEHTGTSLEEGLKLFDRKRETYKASIESFAQRLKRYIDKQGTDFRLNFFVDEVGQFVSQDTKLMLNLQTIAETCATVCEGRVWIVVTSQGDLQRVIGDLNNSEGEDFTRIQARFKTRLTLTGADVREVIQKRLLAKCEAEPEVLTAIYDRERENLQTLYRFGDGSVQYKNWRGSDQFCAFYPFSLYQFDLFQRAIEQLSRHDAFTGKHTSIGERSMLAVFQEVAKHLKDQPVGQLATFDLMFDGIASSIRGDLQTSLRQAERQLDNPQCVKILKALFLLKWVREFKSSVRNIAILLIDRADIEIADHTKAVAASLQLLESQSYLQRNGDVYEFLTDAEKDIEVEIRNTDIDEHDVIQLLGDAFYKDILKNTKIRYEENGTDYAYARRIDDQLVGQDQEVAFNLVTPDHPNHDRPEVLAAQNTGKAELLALLPADDRLMVEARLYLKTQKYAQQTIGSTSDAARETILTARREQNSRRRTDLSDRCRELLSKAPLYLNGSRLENVGTGEARNRFAKAAQELVRFAYPNLRMLKGRYDEQTLRKTLKEESDLFADGEQPLSEAEQEVLTLVKRRGSQQERIYVEDLIRAFGKRPYGWYPMAVLTLIARLFKMNKLELRIQEILDSQTALEMLLNSRRHGSIRVGIQEQFSPSDISAVKDFYHNFFDRQNTGSDARTVGQLVNADLRGELSELKGLRQHPYPFLSQLDPIIAQLEKLVDRDYAYYLKHLDSYAHDLLTAKEDVIDPLKAFLRGSQRQAYDEAVAFLKEEAANFAACDAEPLARLRRLQEAEAPYRGRIIPDAKAAAAELRKQIDARIQDERESARTLIEEYRQRLRKLPDFSNLEPEKQARVLQTADAVEEEVEQARFISTIRDTVNQYTVTAYPRQLALAQQLATPAADAQPEGEDEPQTTYIPVGQLKVPCDLPYIADEAQLEAWLAALRKAALQALRDGRRISL